MARTRIIPPEDPTLQQQPQQQPVAVGSMESAVLDASGDQSLTTRQPDAELDENFFTNANLGVSFGGDGSGLAVGGTATLGGMAAPETASLQLVGPAMVGGSSSSGTQGTNGGLVGGLKPPTLAGMFWCRKCLMNQQVAVMQTRGNIPICSMCVNAYGSLSGRWRTNRQLKVWWQALKEPAQAEWYRRQHKVAERGQRRSCEDMGTVLYSETVATYNQFSRDSWIPFSVYIRNKFMEGVERTLAARMFLDVVRSGNGAQ